MEQASYLHLTFFIYKYVHKRCSDLFVPLTYFSQDACLQFSSRLVAQQHSMKSMAYRHYRNTRE